MPITVKILADSIAKNGKRITTKLCTYPRAIHSEIMTHRMLVKSSASSRAIPVEKLIQRIVDDPWIPSYIGKNQRGMQAGEELNEENRREAVYQWLRARDRAVEHAQEMVNLGAHKQVVNRLLEPWMFITVIITGTEWNNFFALRRHPAAEPHFHELADKMWEAREASTPRLLEPGEWHLPMWFDTGGHPDDEKSFLAYEREIGGGALFNDAGRSWEKSQIAVARCARVSYLTHDGRRDLKEDIDLYKRLTKQVPPHAAPLEHVAMALDQPERHGCFIGWKSHRMMLPNESVPG